MQSPRIGWRDIAYLAFVASRLSLIVLLEIGGLGSDAAGRGAGFLIGIGLWALVTLPYFLWNLVALIGALHREHPAGKPALGAALPVLCAILGGPLLDLLWHNLVR